jgi:hypothetical protein
MTREEQLQFCKVCKNKKFDPHKGIVCALTGEQADFQETCSNYGENAEAAQKAKREADEALRQYKSDVSVSGWLAFFLWVGIGVGLLFTIIFSFIELVNNFHPLIFFFYLIINSCYGVVGVSTIIAFYKRKTNAVSLARTYILMVVIEAISVVFMSCFGAELDIFASIRSFIWATIWFVYLSVSKKVELIIPEETRTWGKLEKIALFLHIGVCLILTGLVLLYVML